MNFEYIQQQKEELTILNERINRLQDDISKTNFRRWGKSGIQAEMIYGLIDTEIKAKILKRKIEYNEKCFQNYNEKKEK